MDIREMSINEQMGYKYRTGCIECGRGPAEDDGVWRVKLLDPMNRQVEICVDCFKAMKILEVKNVQDNKDEEIGSDGEPDKGNDTGKPKTEGKEPNAGKQPKQDVEG